MWKFLNESVGGTSHRESGTPCQDASLVTPYRTADGEPVLILACADGAGSAKESLAGATLACQVVADAAMRFLDAAPGASLRELSADTVRGWVRTAHNVIVGEAAGRGLAPRDFACTLAFALVGAASAAFAQVGDGAIVIGGGGDDAGGDLGQPMTGDATGGNRAGGDAPGTVVAAGNEPPVAPFYRPVFWPQAGEYQNETYFVTDPAFEANVQCEVRAARVRDVAMFTDGLQRLALSFAAKAAHGPFFEPMFLALRGGQDRDELIVPMRQFLDSPAVNDRTDDDKTLIIATRIEGDDATV